MLILLLLIIGVTEFLVFFYTHQLHYFGLFCSLAGILQKWSGVDNAKNTQEIKKSYKNIHSVLNTKLVWLY